MLDQIDKSLFLFLNSLNSPAWDRIMWIISGKATWVPLYIIILLLVWDRYRKKILVILPVMILAVVISDQLSVHAFKEVFMRLRPCHEPSLEGLVHIVNGKCGGKYGFVSSHASNSFAVALISLLLLKKRWFTVFILVWASVVGYSRIYLGVHYPGDVICGAILGSVAGWLLYLLYRFTDRRYLQFMKPSSQNKSNDVSD
jgi:undecaprenyl-diphosphatase